MARRLHLFLLTILAGAGAGLAPGAEAQSQAEPAGAVSEAPQVVEPQVVRHDAKPAKVATQNFEVGMFIGSLSIENFGTSGVVGSRFAYHFTEDWFAEATYGGSKADKTSYVRVSGVTHWLSENQRDYRYYDVAVGWNALPGELFFGERAMPCAVYFTLGAGNTDFVDTNHFTVALGAGLRLLVNDWLALHLDARDHMYNSDISGNNTLNQNLDFTLGYTVFF